MHRYNFLAATKISIENAQKKIKKFYIQINLKKKSFNFLMQAMVLRAPRQPLEATEIPVPVAGPGQVLLQVRACAVCRTDLHVVDGELPEPKLPLIPGHEIVGVVVARGPGAERFQLGDPKVSLEETMVAMQKANISFQAALQMVGRSCGEPRLPLVPATSDERDRVRKALEDAGLLA